MVRNNMFFLIICMFINLCIKLLAEYIFQSNYFLECIWYVKIRKKKIITSCKREKSKFEKDRILHPQD